MGSEVKGAAQGAVAMMEMEEFEDYRCRKRIRRKERRKEKKCKGARELESGDGVISLQSSAGEGSALKD